MTDQPPTISDDDLHAFVDGALDPERRRSVKAALSQDPDAAARVAAYRSQAEALHTAYDPVRDAPLPEGLRRAAPRPAPAVWSLRAAAALLILGGAAGWLLNDAGNPSANYFAELTGVASEAHRIYAAEVRHPVEVAAEEQAHLFAWLSNRLGSAVWAPNLSDQGYSPWSGAVCCPRATAPPPNSCTKPRRASV
jgi:anti-sigma factor RsiW